MFDPNKINVEKRERTKTTMRRKEIERMEQQMKREKGREKKMKV